MPAAQQLLSSFEHSELNTVTIGLHSDQARRQLSKPASESVKDHLINNSTTATTTTTTTATAQMITNTSNTDNTGGTSSQHIITVPQPPSSCRLCDRGLGAREDWRSHVKSHEHVQRLQLKVAAAAGHSTSELSSLPGLSVTPSPTRRRRDVKEDEQSPSHPDDDDDNDSDEEEDRTCPEAFDPRQCLFCNHSSGDLSSSLTHMSAQHAFIVPSSDLLSDNDPTTLLEFLHFIIHAYRECIACGMHRSSALGIKQHMLAKGHCRFDIGPETEGFYAKKLVSEEENNCNNNAAIALGMEDAQREGSMSVRLASGKIIAHRDAIHDNNDTEMRPFFHHQRRRQLLPEPEERRSHRNLKLRKGSPSSGSQEIAHRQEVRNGSGQLVRSNEAILAAQLCRMQVRSEKMQQSLEGRRRGRLEAANNRIWMERFRMDAGDARIDKRL